MVFSSTIFLFYFFPLFLLLYFLSPGKIKNIWLLMASVFFYAWGAPEFVFIVLASLVIDYYIVHLINRFESIKYRKILVSASVFLNLGMLCYFKYMNFLVENVNDLLSSVSIKPIEWMPIALPIGISFFTFQKITYSLDVYRKVSQPLKNLADYVMYILMFPQLIAGPIVRFNEVAGQITDRKSRENTLNRFSGFFRFVVGLSKKVLIANVLGEQVDKIFILHAGDMNSAIAWIGIVAYAFQIYYDFSGYSDMAIGIGKMIGFRFPENFNNPYISISISEFWRRWHITLGQFMRDYLYIPLGGNRVSTKGRLYFNLWVVFLLSGLWHGAAWTFVIWGAYHGLFLIFDRIFLLKFYKKTGRIPAIIITFIVTLVGWVFFRSEDLKYAWMYLGTMFSFDFSHVLISFDKKFYMIMGIAALFAFYGGIRKIENWQYRVFYDKPSATGIILMTIFSIVFLILCIGSITSQGFNPFIYYRF